MFIGSALRTVQREDFNFGWSRNEIGNDARMRQHILLAALGCCSILQKLPSRVQFFSNVPLSAVAASVDMGGAKATRTALE
ncbi:hypothetical protein [Caballeronia sp. RCC_10]|uniref:hypothetical protein n=1 Tax=Caballeronia sp. RCC_10 TaxID=3239227 RepID=UPI0035232BAD